MLSKWCVNAARVATEYRYPGDGFEPTDAEANNALNLADELPAFVTTALAQLDSEPCQS